VCGIDRDQAIHEAQGEAADAALGEVGLQHRRPEPGSSPAGSDRGAQLEPDRLQDLLVQAGGEVPLEQVEGSDVDQLRLAVKGGEHIVCEAGPGVTLPGNTLSNVGSGVEQVGGVRQLPQPVVDQPAVGIGDPRAGAPRPVDAQEGLQGSLLSVALNLISAWRSCLSRARA